MALRTVKLGVGKTHAVPTGVAPMRHTSMEWRDSTRPYSAASDHRSFKSGKVLATGVYRPTPMPKVHIYIPYADKVRNEIV